MLCPKLSEPEGKKGTKDAECSVYENQKCCDEVGDPIFNI